MSGFSPPTGSTVGGTTVTLTGVNFGGTASIAFGTTNAGGITVVNATTITVTAPAHAAGTVDIAVTTNGQTAAIHGYTYVDTGGITTQPALHPLPGSGSGVGGNVVPAPAAARHEDAGSGGQLHAATSVGVAAATPNAQPGRH